MLDRILVALFALALLGGGAFYVLTLPRPIEAAQLPAEGSGDAERGRRVFWAGGCASCHAAPGATGEAALVLAGGEPLETPFGTFHAPNISPDPANGIGAWSLADFANAMKRGLSPEGEHYYPAFPYTSYARMTDGDVADLWAFLKTVPATAGRAPENELSFPFNVRRGVGLWKLLFMPGDHPIVALAADAGEPATRGRYLVEGPGHCGQCHTPRSFGGAGGLIDSEWLAGAPNPEGRGRIPNITPAGAVADWSESDLVEYFTSGFTPDFDSVGGSMAAVQRNLAQLPDEDRAAIAAYLKRVPSVESAGAAISEAAPAATQ